jgi:hypothetical protein
MNVKYNDTPLSCLGQGWRLLTNPCFLTNDVPAYATTTSIFFGIFYRSLLESTIVLQRGRVQRVSTLRLPF